MAGEKMSQFRFGTVGSPVSTPKKPGGSVGAVQQTHSLGLSALELGWVQSVRVSEDTCRQIQATAAQLDVAISVHAPYFINLNADDEEWPKSRQRLMDAAYYGFLAGATDIVFHPGSYFNQSPDKVLEKAIQRLAGCVSELKANNILVTLRPETMGKSAMLGSLEDTLIMSQQVEHVQPCLDFAHLHARAGDGSMNSRQEWLQVLKNYQNALGAEALQRLHIHLSGIEYGAKGEKNHLPLRESDFALRELFLALKEMSCSGRILCESPVLEEDALFMKQVWEEL
jgi:deoxyribonuclease-4